MIAVKRLQSLFWVLFVALGALSAYLVSLKVATERNELMRVRTQIASARADIRYLETEFSARSNMRQLEQWASQDFHYSALGADRYLTDERQLAQLDGLQPNGPDYAPQPVLVAMIERGDRAEPQRLETAEDKAEQAPVRAVNLAAMRLPAETSNIVRVIPTQQPKAAKAGMEDMAGGQPFRLAKAEKARKAGSAVEPAARKAERMAMLDAQLLDSRTLGELGRKAASEGGRSAR